MHPLIIRLLPSGFGDCILLSSGDVSFLFDGGTASSYKEWKDVIVDLHKIDGLFITHIDNDHINGIIKLIQDNDRYDKPKLVEIADVFFNGAEQILNDNIANDISNQMDFLRLIAYYDENENGKNIGYSEGTGLSYLLKKFGYPVNRGCENGIFCRESMPTISLSGISIDVIGPSISALRRLKNDWNTELQRQRISSRVLNKIHAQSFELFISNICSEDKSELDFSGNISHSVENDLTSLANSPYTPDNSPANCSSICLLADFAGKKILMLGDINCETVIEWLDNKGISEIKIDALKVSHHGSKKNTNKELVSRINTNNYIISTDGNLHKHPDMETLAKIAYYSPSEEIVFHFNYCHEHLDYELLKGMPNKKISFNFSGTIEI